MRVEFADDQLRDLEAGSRAASGQFKQSVERGFRKRMQLIRAATSEADLYKYRGNGFEKLVGDRAGQYSIRITGNMRLIVELIEDGAGEFIVRILEITDYHGNRRAR